MQKYLKENLRAVRLFLNTLGLSIEEFSDIDNYQIKDVKDLVVLKSLKIMDQYNQIVGKLGFGNDKLL